MRLELLDDSSSWASSGSRRELSSFSEVKFLFIASSFHQKSAWFSSSCYSCYSNYLGEITFQKYPTMLASALFQCHVKQVIECIQWQGWICVIFYREESKLNVSVATLGCYKSLNVDIQANSRVKKAWQWDLLEQSHQFHSATTPRAAHCWKSPHDWGVKKKKPAWFISCWRLLLFVGECEIEMSTELIDISSSSIFSHTWNANTNSELFWPQSCLFHSPEVFLSNWWRRWN